MADLQLALLVGSGLLTGFVMRPVLEKPFYVVVRRAKRPGFAHLCLVLLGSLLGMLAFSALMVSLLWLLGLLPLHGRAALYFVALAVGAVAYKWLVHDRRLVA